ncbi:glycosyltransferase family 2 protein [Chengkuizengella marina]|uniref:Glycosyltransferase family 2 protein n=1 Tax=Chengkuizengella marina TaxID=2507566 RepID=A0A6N9Q0L2_9BACL|nr:glycosyltransferase family A protein [Chengkuizengella marina]NBI28716.1 glycosyltransferase family 2 protein [Chengkuizengella marina]
MINSVIIRCYNTLPLIKKSINAVIETTDKNTEIILVNNHPPYQEAMEYLQNFNHIRVSVLDPGQNIGSIAGINFGAHKAVGENLVILDDDIIVPNNNWIQVMAQSLNQYPNLAYVSLAWHAMINHNTSPLDKLIERPEYTIRFMKDVVILGCTMVKKSLWKKYFKNINTSYQHWYGTDKKYKAKANELGMDSGIILSHIAEHLSRTEESDFLYDIWKVLYAFGLTLKNYTEWKENKTSLSPLEEYALKLFNYPTSQIKKCKQLLTENNT